MRIQLLISKKASGLDEIAQAPVNAGPGAMMKIANCR